MIIALAGKTNKSISVFDWGNTGTLSSTAISHLDWGCQGTLNGYGFNSSYRLSSFNAAAQAFGETVSHTGKTYSKDYGN